METKKQENIKYRKAYLTDTSFALELSDIFTANAGFLLENIVLLELYRHRLEQQYDLFYYKKSVEVDFVIYKNRKASALIQVCYDISNEKTLKREIRALVEASKELQAEQLLILTYDDTRTIEIDNLRIEVKPVYVWILENNA